MTHCLMPFSTPSNSCSSTRAPTRYGWQALGPQDRCLNVAVEARALDGAWLISPGSISFTGITRVMLQGQWVESGNNRRHKWAWLERLFSPANAIRFDDGRPIRLSKETGGKPGVASKPRLDFLRFYMIASIF